MSAEAWRILVTGSREWANEHKLALSLDYYRATAPNGIIIVHGAAKGADLMAERWARGIGVRYERHPADWGAYCGPRCESHRRVRRDGATYCPHQGGIRNQKMVDLGAHVCVAFPMRRSRGTWDCVDRARDAGIPVVLRGEPRPPEQRSRTRYLPSLWPSETEV
ncbi:DprA-like DNA processing chain A [Mycobacterium phage VasuNzinga]|uniref:DprA-like DNA processing chain A n=1 Tax=Mycobacterium phage VasuNzinga TaxID=2301620 RepID=A0A385UK21_9CAUD|nr:DprA-like DNA processing chain A [Mycobacterium phage VasuNzinga]